MQYLLIKQYSDTHIFFIMLTEFYILYNIAIEYNKNQVKLIKDMHKKINY